MLTVDTRNSRYVSAKIKLVRATQAAERAQKAIDDKAKLQEEIDWLATAPVKDGQKGEGLPTDNDVEVERQRRLDELKAKRAE